MVILAILQTYLFYSPVPVWDLWTGYLEFYLKAADGNWSAWWSQHIEHRILLARLLFWVDIRFFSGSFIFLLIINYIFLSLIALLFWKTLEQQLVDTAFKARRIIIGLFITAWLFLLCQGENLIWAFQVEFFLAFLLPFCALYFLQKSIKDNKTSFFLAACICGALSAGTLAIGVVTFPLMSVYALLMRQKPMRIAALAILSVLILFLYFHGYQSGTHTVTSPEITNNLFAAFLFMLTLIGSPFYYVLGPINPGMSVIQVFGLIFIIGFLYKIVQVFVVKCLDPLQAAVLFFILYIIGSAVGTTGGRFFFGLDAALTPHHTTPAVIGWAALIALFAKDIPPLTVAWRKWLILAPAAGLAIFMVKYQVKALIWYNDEVYFDRKVSILGLSLGALDDERLQTLTAPPEFRIIPPIAEKAYVRHLSIFGAYPFLGAREAFGAAVPLSPLPACVGFLDYAQSSNDQRFIRIGGWLIDPGQGAKPEVARLLSEDGQEVGFALVGQPRPDVTHADGALNPGFRGYALASAAGQRLIVRGENRQGPLCQMNAQMPQSLFSTKPAKPSPDETTIDTTKVLPGNQWTGYDDAHTNICGLKVYGSLITGAVDKGSIALTLKRGDRILYRSGPSGGNQTVEVAGQPGAALPNAINWIVLDFSNPNLPQDGFVAKFIDNGGGWGEWSAIAVKDNQECH